MGIISGRLNKMFCKLIQGDVFKVLPTLKSKSVDIVMTSPPYYGLRDYRYKGQIGLEKTPELYVKKMTMVFKQLLRVLKKTGTFWLNIGDTYSANRTYQVEQTKWKSSKSQVRGVSMKPSLPSKCMLMIPERLAFSAINCGFILRNKIIWYKPNHMPSSVKDRFTNAWEYLYLFSKAKKYFFDLDSVRENHKSINKPPGNKQKDRESKLLSRNPTKNNAFSPLGKNPGDVLKFSSNTHSRIRHGLGQSRLGTTHKLGKNPSDIIKIGMHHGSSLTKGRAAYYDKQLIESNPSGKNPGDIFSNGWKGDSQERKLLYGRTASPKGYWGKTHPLGKPPEDFWSINTQPFPEAHFAVFPEELCERPIKAGCPKEVCKKCGKPRERITKLKKHPALFGQNYPHGKIIEKHPGYDNVHSRETKVDKDFMKYRWLTEHKTTGWTKCDCNRGFEPGIILDPFMGSGTVGIVAIKYRRNFIGIDLVPDYIKMAKKRLNFSPKNPLIKFEFAEVN